MNVFGPTDGAFATAQNAGLIPTDPNGELLKSCKKGMQVHHPAERTLISNLSVNNFTMAVYEKLVTVRIVCSKHD